MRPPDRRSRSLKSAMPDLQQETAELLQRLIRFKTVNPPGAERECQEHLAGLLRDAGFEVELLGRTEERPNLIARLPGEADGPRLVLLSHVDTVLAEADDWRHDPWSGEIAGGELWGRGAQDMKNHTAAEVMAAVSLVREGWRPARGELVIVATVDEETGGTEGAVWLCENHPEKVRCDYVINEGAGTVMPFDGTPVYGVCVAEKGVFRFTLTTRGAAGHASMPGVGDNALLKMAPLLERLAQNRPGLDVTDAPQSLLTALELDNGGGDAAAALARLKERDPALAGFVEPMLSVTMAPTIISASEKINVLPAAARLQVDCRVPPGHGEETAIKRVREVLGEDGYEIEFHEKVVGNGSRLDSPLMDAITNWVGRVAPDARVVPTMLPAFTDSRTFREAFPDVVAYGFFPQRQKSLYDAWPLMHGKDERIDVRDIGFAVDCYRDVSKELLG
jgi:acetylornithine deacetylase/succinyl-diaminopimelate desuccinylase-like protein